MDYASIVHDVKSLLGYNLLGAYEVELFTLKEIFLANYYHLFESVCKSICITSNSDSDALQERKS